MWYEPIFKDRTEAGKALGEAVRQFGDGDVVVLGLPRGGVPVAYEVAQALGAPLDVFIVRKLGVPGQEELAFGAIASGGVTVFNESLIRTIRMPAEMIEAVVKREDAELARREQLYRAGMPPLDVAGKTVIVVDDGLATGATMAAAVQALMKLGPKQIIVGVPVASKQACDELDGLDNVRSICIATPEPFYGVGMWYQDFSQTTDKEVQALLADARGARASRANAK